MKGGERALSLSIAGTNAVASIDVRACQSLNPIPINYLNAVADQEYWCSKAEEVFDPFKHRKCILVEEYLGFNINSMIWNEAGGPSANATNTALIECKVILFYDFISHYFLHCY